MEPFALDKLWTGMRKKVWASQRFFLQFHFCAALTFSDRNYISLEEWWHVHRLLMSAKEREREEAT